MMIPYYKDHKYYKYYMNIPYYKDQHRSSKRCSSAGSEAPGGLCIGAGPGNVYFIVVIFYGSKPWRYVSMCDHRDV